MHAVLILNIWGQKYEANSVDPDQTAPKEQSDLGLHCVLFCRDILLLSIETLSDSLIGMHKF